MSIVLGCDLGAKFGWAIGDSDAGPNGKILECDVCDLARYAKPTRSKPTTGLYMFARKLVVDHGVTVFCREDSVKTLQQAVRNQRESKKNLQNALKHHAKYAAILELLIDLKKLDEIDPVDPRTLKKWAVNNGNAKKDQMTRAAKLLYGIDTDDGNAADAAHVCAWAMLQHRRAGKPPF